MDVDAVTLFLALLAVVAQVSVVALLVLRAMGGGRWAAVDELVGPWAVPLALGVAVTAMAGSLYLSEGAGFPPCHLCWAQRAAIYPLVPLLAWGWWSRARWVRRAALALNAVGLPVSLYHVALERLPRLETGVCAVANPCSTIWVDRLGYLTIPVMAATAQALVATLLLLLARPAGGPTRARGPAPADPLPHLQEVP